MIVDSSALLSVVKAEPDAALYAAALRGPHSASMSAGTHLEASIVVERSRDPIATRKLDDLIAASEITIEPFTAEQAQIAREAYRDFGKGSGHPANLNFGDCIAYALAKDRGESLLYKGTDFSHTDVRSALD